jgi:DNA (cytosine-5)-methyltransferase 1
MGAAVTRPKRTLQLGDDALLRMDMTQAANYWNVPAPLSKRTTKSGAKKRTQAQTELERLKLLAS